MDRHLLASIYGKALTRLFTRRRTGEFGLNGFFFVNNMLRKLTHEAATNILVNHRARAIRVTNMFIGCMTMAVRMTM